MPITIYGQLIFGAIVCVCLLAVWLGETAEKRAGALILLNNVAASLVNFQVAVDVRRYIILTDDAICLVLLILIARTSQRSWTIWAAACQAVTVAVMIARITGLHMLQGAYATSVNLATYGLLTSLAVGTFIVWRERRALQAMSPSI